MHGYYMRPIVFQSWDRGVKVALQMAPQVISQNYAKTIL